MFRTSVLLSASSPKTPASSVHGHHHNGHDFVNSHNDSVLYASSVSSPDLSPSPSTSHYHSSNSPYFSSSSAQFLPSQRLHQGDVQHSNMFQFPGSTQLPDSVHPDATAPSLPQETAGSLPHRPDSPRPLLHNQAACVRARLTQLAVWGHAAEDERFDASEHLPEPCMSTCQPMTSATAPSPSPSFSSPSNASLPSKCPPNLSLTFPPPDDSRSTASSDDQPSVPPSPVAHLQPSLRPPDRMSSLQDPAISTVSRRRSLFCPRPNETISRKPSLWARCPSSSSSQSTRNPPTSFADSRGHQSHYPGGNRPMHCASAALPHRSSRRPQSFHRYARIVPDGHVDRWRATPTTSVSSDSHHYRSNHSPALSGSAVVHGEGPVYGNDEFDDLVHGLHATKVTETHLHHARH